MERPRAAIVGTGLMGRWHAHYAARLGVEIAAVVDPCEQAAAALRRRFPGARAFRALEECLEAERIDVVHLCAAPASQAALAEAALRAGRHVLVEKPAATSVRAAEALIALARDRGLRLCPVHQLPFQHGMLRLLERRQELGELVRLEHVTCSAGGEGRDPAGRRELLLEILPHPVSLFRALLGGGTPPGAWALAFTEEELLLFAPRGRTQLGVFVSLRGRPTRNELVVVGTRATARADLFHGFSSFESWRTTRADKALGPFRRGAGLLASATANLTRRLLAGEPAYPGLPELMRRFYRSLAEREPAPVAAEELIEAAALIERVRGGV